MNFWRLIREIPRHTAGGLPRVYWALWASMLINRVGAFAMMFLPLYLKDGRGLSLTLAGLVTAAYGVGGAAGSLLGGVLADTWGRRRTLVLANFSAAGLMLALGLATPLWAIAILTAVIGVFHSMPGPALVAATIDVVPEQARSRAFNLQVWAFNLGMAAAATLAGVIAGFGFFPLFAADAAMTLATAVVIFLFVPETLSSKPATAGKERRGLAVPLMDPHFMAFVGLTFVLAFLTLQSSILQLAMDGDGLPPSAYGLVAALPGVLVVIGQLFVPRLIKGRVKGHVLGLALAFLGVGYFSITFASVLPFYLGAAAVWTVGNMLAAPPNAEVIAELAPAALRARYQAVFYLTYPAAGFVAPALGGWSLEHLGSWHWTIVGLLGLAAAGGHLAASRSRERRLFAGQIRDMARISASERGHIPDLTP